MVSIAAFRKLALSMPDTTEGPHFESTAFLAKGKIFATLNTTTGRAVVKLLPEQQEMMATAEPKIFQPIPNYWGNKGWTSMHLTHADKSAAESAVRTAWENITAPKPSKTRKKTAAKRKATRSL